MVWCRTTKFDPICCALADRHYPALLGRRKMRSPQWLPPGRTVALRTAAGDAAFGMLWPEFRRDDFAGAWINTFFRKEGDGLASEMILEALAAVRAEWGDPPGKGVITFIDQDAIRRKRDPGRCYRKAGFAPAGYTKEFGRLIVRLAPELVPPPAPALKLALALF